MKKISTISFLAVAAFALTAPSVSAEGFDHLLIIGDATPGIWSISDGLMMVQDTENTGTFHYTGWLEADKDFKFTADTDFRNSNLELRNASENPSDFSRLVPADQTSDDYKFRVPESANYDLTVNVNDLTISISKAEYQDKPVRYNVLYAVGSAFPGKWDLGTKATPLLNSKDNPFELKTEVALTSNGDKNGEFKFCANPFANWGGVWFHPYYEVDSEGNVVDSSIDYNKLTDNNSHDVKWLIAPDEAGKYAVRINPDDMTFSKTKTVTTGVENISISETSAAVSYYDLQGIRTTEPRRGCMYIEVDAGGFARKIIF